MKKILKKLLVTICLIITLFTFLYTKTVYAEEEPWGGVLIKPVINLTTALGDGIIDIIQKSIMQQDVSFLQIKVNSDWKKWGGAIFGIILAIVVIAVAAYFAPAALLAALGANTIITISAGTILGAGVAGYFVVDRIDGADFPQNIDLPIFSLTPEKIFLDEIYLFDIDFFNIENKNYNITEYESEQQSVKIQKGTKTILENSNMENGEDQVGYRLFYRYTNIGSTDVDTEPTPNADDDMLLEVIFGGLPTDHVNDLRALLRLVNKEYNNVISLGDNSKWIISIATAYDPMGKDGNNLKSTLRGTMYIKDENEDLIFIVRYNWVREEKKELTKPVVSEKMEVEATKDIEVLKEVSIPKEVTIESTAQQLSKVVSSWYFVLRNLALLMLMLVLIYIGIRIVIGSAGQKAKYKERLMDWLIAICLVMVMQYIMVFAVGVVGKITELVSEVSGIRGKMAVIDLTNEQLSTLESKYNSLNLNGNSYIDGNTLFWDTDLMGQIKILSQRENEGTVKWVGLSLAYLILVFYTVFFIWTYLKRVLYVAFLTMIAPLVAMTYPIDKITDGKAQAFNTWLKEYLFNLMIQPMHLLLYTILITAAYEIAARSAIYTLVAIGFMIPAEKLVRKFFGFEKAKTPGLLGGTAGAALAMTGMQSLFKQNSKGKRGLKENHNSRSYSDSSKHIKFSNNDTLDAYDTILNRDEAIQGLGERKKQPECITADNSNINETASQFSKTSDDSLGTIENSVPTSLQTTPTVQSKTSKGTFKRNANRTINTITGVSRAYAKGLGNKALRRIKNGRPIRALAGGALGVIGGGALGLTGLALGIASGDPKKAFEYTTIGATGGYGLGKGIAGSVVDTLSVDSKEISDEVERSIYGEDYNKHKYEEDIKKDLESEKNINYVRDVYSYTRTEAKEFLQNEGRIFYDSGIRDIEEMISINETVRNKQIPSFDEAIAASKLKEKLPNKISKMTDKKRREYKETYKNAYKNKLIEINNKFGIDNPNRLTDQKIEEISEQKANDTIKFIENLESAQSSLNKV